MLGIFLLFKAGLENYKFCCIIIIIIIIFAVIRKRYNESV